MSAAGPSVGIRNHIHPGTLPRTFALPSTPPILVNRDVTEVEAGPARRSKIWEFNTNLHCSIIGTCLSTGELRQVLRKLDLAPATATDHELHGIAVSLAARHDLAAKLLNKALDHRHKLAVNQFAKADKEDKLRTLWRDAVRRGEIPGAYWATLTHPATTRAIISEAFGDVHMLSHLVGSANRADIRRLCQLEAEKADLETKLDRQQRALHEAVVTRNEQIQELSKALVQRITAEQAPGAPIFGEESAMLRQLVADLERRLAGETRRRTTLEARLTETRSVLAQERAARISVEQENESLRGELLTNEAAFTASVEGDASMSPRLDSIALLYVGGRPNQIVHLRTAAERLGAVFLHHDGGVENHTNLLPGLTSRADIVAFPVDCISHEAALTVKSLCQQSGKRFIPLRSASVTALLAALRQPDITALADAAD